MTARWEDSGRPKGRQPEMRDPYLRWAMHTAWRSFARQAGWSKTDDPLGEVRVIGRVANAADLKKLLGRANSPRLEVPDVYFSPLPGTDYKTCHFTATLKRSKVESWLIKNPLGVQWRLALSMRDALRTALPTSKGLYGPDRDAAVMRAKNLVAKAIPAKLDHPANLDGVLALIDHGCPFLHEKFRADTGTRVAAIWDQGAQPRLDQQAPQGWPWAQPQKRLYGREIGPLALNAIAMATLSDSSLDETAVYRSIDFMIDADDARRRVWYGTHGGHLLDVLAGKPDPLSPQADDLAGQANLVFVQLPTAAALDSAGASLSAHLLDGVRYVLSVCEPRKPLVINISYGGHTGPHDGSSLIETALDEVLKHCVGNVAVVLAAGNARESRCHAQRQVRPNRSVMLRLALSAGDSTDTFVELWHDKPSMGQSLEYRVRPPNRTWSPWVGPGQEAVLRSDSANQDVVAFLRHDDKVPLGRRSMALLAVAPTEQPADQPCDLAEAGVWEIEARIVSTTKAHLPPDSCVSIDAWIEREDPNRAGGAHKPYFIDQEPGDEEGTLSGIATGAYTLVVGGFNLATRQAAPYSSLASQQGPRPALLAACEDDANEPTIAAAATRSSEVLRLNGTSVAAPVLARRLFQVMHDHGPFDNAEEIREVATFLALSGVDPCLRPYTTD